MSVLAIIPCSKEKIWDRSPQLGAVEARAAYRSAFHHLTRQYAESHADYWIILSAKYGFMEPSFMIAESYDITFGRAGDPYITDAELARQASAYQAGYSRVIVLCPSLYERRVREAFSFAEIETPLKGVGGWGAMHRFLRENC